MRKSTFTRKMWVYFRGGHNQYLVYAMAMGNFTLIAYNFLIKEISFINNLIPNYYIFVLLFIPLYVPIASLVGYWHVKTQVETDFFETWKTNRHIVATLENQKTIMNHFNLKYVSEYDIDFDKDQKVVKE